MGEAKKRKLNDPFFGKKPKLGRGIFLSAPIVVEGTKINALSSSIDPVELRMSVLFWDRLLWLDSNIISFGSNSDEVLLESEGILNRPRPEVFVGKGFSSEIARNFSLVRLVDSADIKIDMEQAKDFSRQHIEEFLALEAKEPGQWVMAEGENSIILKDIKFTRGRGQLVRLVRAIPLPGPDFPLPELLRFREKRMAEIVAFNYEIDHFYSNITKSDDPNFEFNRLLSVIDRKCADLIAVSKESKWPLHLGDLNISFSLDNFESAMQRATWGATIGAAIGATIGVANGLPAVSAIIGGVLGSSSFLSWDKSVGFSRRKSETSPFNIVGRIHKEIINKK